MRIEGSDLYTTGERDVQVRLSLVLPLALHAPRIVWTVHPQPIVWKELCQDYASFAVVGRWVLSSRQKLVNPSQSSIVSVRVL